MIEEQNSCLEEMTKKLADYNHRFNDLTDVLKLHFSSGNVHEKLTALVEASCDSDNQQAGTSSTRANQCVKASPKKRVLLDDKKPAVLRAQHLKEQIDLFRDECKL